MQARVAPLAAQHAMLDIVKGKRPPGDPDQRPPPGAGEADQAEADVVDAGDHVMLDDKPDQQRVIEVEPEGRALAAVEGGQVSLPPAP